MRLHSPNLLIALLIAVAVPIVGFWTGSHRMSTLDAEASEAIGLPMVTVCEINRTFADRHIATECTRYATASYMRAGSLVVGAVGLALVLGIALLAAWAGTDRERNARAFPGITPPAMVLIGLITVSQVVILVVTLFTLGLRGGLLGVLAIGGLIAGGVLVASLRTLLRRTPLFEVAVAVPRRHESEIIKLVRDVASSVGAKPPANVIVGNEPNFYVTGATVALPYSAPLPAATEVLTGETLYLSLPLLKLFTEEEVRAVVGHELGHFIGQDAVYSQRFAPAYRALLSGLDELESWSGSWVFWVAQLPAVTLTNFLLTRFGYNERRIGRAREFEADRVGAAAAGPDALGSSLVKVGLMHELWPRLEAALDDASRGRRRPSVSGELLALVRSTRPDALRAAASVSVRKSVPHPTDTHPETAERLRALGVKPADIDFSFVGAWGDDPAAAEEIGRLEREVASVEAMVLRN